MFSKSKRFVGAAQLTPGVGQYEITQKHSGNTSTFSQEERFNKMANETKDSNLDMSNCSTKSSESTSSNHSVIFATPGKPCRQNKNTLSSSGIPIRCKSRQTPEKENLALRISNLQQEINQLRYRNETLEKIMTASKNSFEKQLELARIGHKTQLEVLERVHEDKLSVLPQLMEQKTSLENTIARCECQITALQQELKEAIAVQISSSDEIRKLKNEREQSRLSIEELARQEETVNNARQEVSQLKKEMQRKDDQSLRNLQNLTEKCQMLENQLVTVEQDRVTEVESLQKELELSKQSLNQIQEEYKALNQLFKELKNNYDIECTNRLRIEKDFHCVNETIRNMESDLVEAKDCVGKFEEKEKEQSRAIEVLSTKLMECNNTVNVLQQRNFENEHDISENKSLKDEIQTLKDRLVKVCEENRDLFSSEEKIKKLKQEIGRRLVETQKKLSQREIELESCSKELNEHLSTCNTGENFSWKQKYEELEERISPFQEQLDAFEFEKRALLSRNSESQSEIDKLSQQYAKLLGHQNNKQKIRHVLKLKEENIDLKKEVAKLREQAMKQKQTIRRLEENINKKSGVRKFDPSLAFQHNPLENKENTPLKTRTK